MPAKLRLYDENDKYNSAGDEVDRRIHAAVQPIIDEFVKAGYSPRDIQNVAYGAVLDNILCQLIKWTP
jgi:hypothetical protein